MGNIPWDGMFETCNQSLPWDGMFETCNHTHLYFLWDSSHVI